MRRLLSLILLLLITASLVAQTKIGGTGKIGGTVKVSVQASGGGTDFVTDTFTDTDSTALASHTGELGATWTNHPSYTASSVISTNRLVPTGDPQAFYASGVPPNANYKVCASIQNVSDIAVNIGPCGRMDTSANTMYCMRYNQTNWQLRKLLAGTASTLTSSTNQLISVGNSKIGCVHMNGTSIWMTVEGTQEGSTATDSDITAAGRAGFRSAGTASGSTGFHLNSLNAQGL